MLKICVSIVSIISFLFSGVSLGFFKMTLLWWSLSSAVNQQKAIESKGYIVDVRDNVRPSVDFLTRMEQKRGEIFDYENCVANSNASKERAERAGLTVKGVVYHGVIPEQIRSILSLKNNFREFLKEKYGNKIIFGVNESNLERKGWRLFMQAWTKASQQTDNILLYALTNYDLSDYVSSLGNIYVDPSYGKMSRVEVLQKMNAVDVGIVPSLAEGFGMPLLEFNALGKPVIHGDFPPLSEISIVDNYKLRIVNFAKYRMEGESVDGIDYTFMLWDVDEMAKTIVDIAENGARTIDNEKVLEKFDANKLYLDLLDYAS